VMSVAVGKVARPIWGGEVAPRSGIHGSAPLARWSCRRSILPAEVETGRLVRERRSVPGVVHAGWRV
jgi:hypothetical protein